MKIREFEELIIQKLKEVVESIINSQNKRKSCETN